MIRSTGERDKWGYSLWLVRCDCGTEFARSANAFTRAHALQSCGCGTKGRRPKQSHREALFKKHQLNAKYRGLEFELCAEEHAALTQAECAYCGADPVERPHPFLRVSIVSNGIDRIDSSKGYVAGNCVPCCNTCNMAKGQMTTTHFRDWVSRVHRNLGL